MELLTGLLTQYGVPAATSIVFLWLYWGYKRPFWTSFAIGFTVMFAGYMIKYAILRGIA